MKTADTFSERYEEKFIVPLERIREIILDPRGEFAKRFEFDYLLADSLYNVIDNVYFESQDLASYHDHMEGKEERIKIRLRQYNPDGMPEGITFFEIKEKRESKTFKARIVIKPEWLRPFLDTGSFPEMLFSLNQRMKVEKVRDAMQSLRRFVIERKFVPMLRCTYMRHAYKLRDSDRVRITMDRDIRFMRLFYSSAPKYPYPASLRSDDIIVEAKISGTEHGGLIPTLRDWFGQPQSISKFCYGIYETRERYRLEKRDAVLESLKRYRPYDAIPE